MNEYNPGVRTIGPEQAAIVTPQIAKDWLARNEANRTLTDAVVNNFTEAILRGEWRLTGEGVKFSRDGRLLDGQHRLTAVVRADQAVPMYIFVGLEDAAQEVMDSGKKRSASDALKFRGYLNVNLLAAVAKNVTLYRGGDVVSGGSKFTLTGPQAIAWAEGNCDAAMSAIRFATSLSRINMPTGVLATLIFLLREVDPEEADVFFNEVNSRLASSEGSPALALSDRLDKAKVNRELMRLSHHFCMTFRAWNAWRSGDSVSRIQVVKHGKPLPIPEPY